MTLIFSFILPLTPTPNDQTVSLIQVVSEITAVIGYKGKRCAAQTIATTTFDFPLYSIHLSA